MITTEIYNGQGLGNQLWCYIVTRVIAKNKGYEFGIKSPEKFKCNNFLDLDFGKEVIGGTGPEGGPPITLPEEIKYYYKERKITHPENGADLSIYDKDLINILDKTKIDGTMQDEQYIFHRKDEIGKWLKVRKEHECYNFSDENICVINFRGGEYTRIKNIFLPQKYWDDAVENMKKINENFKFVVITDDIETAKKFFPNFDVFHFSISKDYVVVKNAKYLILSNSSFAWFPAWLNKDLKYCIAPKYWSQYNTSDGFWGCGFNITQNWLYQDRDGNLNDYNSCIKEFNEYKEKNKDYFAPTKIKNNFLVVSNYNNDISWVPRYTDNYLIYDQSERHDYPKTIDPKKVILNKHTGHNLSDHLTFIIDNYENLPDCIIFAKGNIFPRHTTQKNFNKIMNKDTFTPIEDTETNKTQIPISFFTNGGFNEMNNDWYVDIITNRIPKKYVRSYNDFLSLIYKNPILPEYIRFAPGGNYIVPKEYIIRFPKIFYENLKTIVSYGILPVEAYFLERAWHTIWTSNLEINEKMLKEIKHNNKNMKTLDEISINFGTDKSSLYHNYTKLYSFYFDKIRFEELKILEIGIDKGYSLKSWKEYFENSEITGIDIIDLKHLEEDRIHIEQGDQKDAMFLKKINDKYGPFDIIIDDGSHNNYDMKASFDCLFPLLKKGGLYIVEDLHACYWGKTHGTGKPVFINLLKKLVDYTNSSGKSGCANIKNDNKDSWYKRRGLGEMNYLEKSIEFLHLYRSIVFIKKHPFSIEDSIKLPQNKKTIFQLIKQVIPSPIKTTIKKILHLLKKYIPIPIKTKTKSFLNIDKKTKLLFKNIINKTKSSLKRQNSSKEIAEYRKKIKIYDILTFFNELDLLEIRLNMLDKYVDYFVIIEATETFSGKPKKIYYEENKHFFKRFEHKIIHHITNDVPIDENGLRKRLYEKDINNLDKEIISNSLTSSNIPKNQIHWLKEFYQKESIKKALTTLSDDDICFVSDVDEIWNPEAKIDYRKNDIFKLKQKVYSYFLNNRSNEPWAGTLVTKYKNIRENCLNHLRTARKTKYAYIKNGGWHFTNMGEAKNIKKKLESYGHQEFNNEEIKSQIEERIKNNEDFIGRKFKFWVDEKDLPEYLLENKDKYKKLFK